MIRDAIEPENDRCLTSPVLLDARCAAQCACFARYVVKACAVGAVMCVAVARSLSAVASALFARASLF